MNARLLYTHSHTRIIRAGERTRILPFSVYITYIYVCTYYTHIKSHFAHAQSQIPGPRVALARTNTRRRLRGGISFQFLSHRTTVELFSHRYRTPVRPRASYYSFPGARPRIRGSATPSGREGRKASAAAIYLRIYVHVRRNQFRTSGPPSLNGFFFIIHFHGYSTYYMYIYTHIYSYMRLLTRNP